MRSDSEAPPTQGVGTQSRSLNCRKPRWDSRRSAEAGRSNLRTDDVRSNVTQQALGRRAFPALAVDDRERAE